MSEYVTVVAHVGPGRGHVYEILGPGDETHVTRSPEHYAAIGHIERDRIDEFLETATDSDDPNWELINDE